MHQYRFVGEVETILSGLSHGVNAVLHRDDHGQPDGATLVVRPGDEVTTDEPYPHALMVNTSSGEADTPGDGDPLPEPVAHPDDPAAQPSSAPDTAAPAPTPAAAAGATGDQNPPGEQAPADDQQHADDTTEAGQ